MNNKERYNATFCEVFDIPEERLPGLNYQDIEAWDSVGHMTLIAQLEEIFEITMNTEDILDFSSYERGMEIISEKYGVSFEQ